MRVWQAEDYDASPVNWSVVTHPDGFVYVGNNMGVLEFDGARWRTLPLPHEGRGEALAIDDKGRIWAAGRDEIALFEPDARGTLRARDLAPLVPAASLPTGTIVQVLATGSGVYLRCPNELIRYRESGSTFAVDVWNSPERIAGLFTVGEKVYISVGTRLETVEDGTFKPVDAKLSPEVPKLAYGELRPWSVRTLADGSQVMLSTDGPLRWNGPGTPIRPYSAEASAIFKDESAQAGVFLSDGRMAFAMTRTGLLILNAAGQVEQQLDRAHGLPHNRIGALATDVEGGLWVALHYGLARLQLDSPFALHGAAQGVEEGSRDFAQQWGRLYVTNGEGLSYRNPAEGRFYPVSGLRVGANQLLSWGNRLFVSCGGLAEVSQDNQTRQLANGILFGLTASRTEPGVLYGASVTGLRVFRVPGEGGEKRRDAASTGVLKNVRLDLWNSLDTGDGFLWVMAPVGEIWRVDFRKGIRLDAPAERFGPDRGVPIVKRSELLRLVLLGGELCVSCADWLVRFDPAAGRFVPETRFEGFGARRGAAVVEPIDPAGRQFWLWPGAGFPEFSRVTFEGETGWNLQKVPAGPLEYLVVNNLFEEASTRTLWIAGQGALVSMDLDWKERGPLPPLQVHVRRVKTAGGEVLFGGDVGRDIDPSLTLYSARETSLRFEFAASTHNADFSGRVRTLYRTKLDGFDDDWTHWSGESVRDFTGLPYRDLNFRVQAKDMWGRESPEDTFEFSIAPPWWLSNWAVAGYTMLAGGFLFVVIGLRTKTLRRRADQLESVVNERTSELGARNQELARLHQLELGAKTAARLAEEKTRLELLRYQLNPHFLYNALGSIRSLVHSRPDEADEMTTQLADFCRMTLTRNDDAGGTLNDEMKMIGSYLEMEKTRWRARLRTQLDVEPAALTWQLPPFLLLPLVENAIKYGTRTSNEVVEVRVSARSTETELIIEVANTGSWVETGRSTAPESTGIGLDNLRQRLQRYFPGAHDFGVTTDGGWVRVTLRLQVAASVLRESAPPL